tara:strand:- start:3234 stop:4343 length:1110 start_codon:yes stop_codon:yes gene_type:complete
MISYKLLESQHNCIILNNFFYHNPKLFNFLIKNFKSINDIIANQNAIINQFKVKNTSCFNELSTYSSQQHQHYLNQNNITILTLNDTHYPTLLKQIAYPPPILFYQGNIECLSKIPLAIIGPREPSAYAKNITVHFTTILSNDFCIVSGLAKGIDGIAHQTTLSNNQSTIAVMGVGLDKCYPLHHKTLKDSILSKKGLILSEIPLFKGPQKFHFPLRNRIISGLSKGIIITEAARNSGSLITANHAIDQNREVFAIPGNIFEKTSEGVNDLIKQGAKCTTSPEDIYDELNINKTKPLKNPENTKTSIPTQELSEIEKNIISCMQSPKNIDELVEETQLTLSDVLHTLTFLEIKKIITKTNGTQFALINS